MGRVGRKSRSQGRDVRSRRPIDPGRTWKFASCKVEGQCAKAGAECKNLGKSGSSSGDKQAHSIRYMSEGDDGCAKAGVEGQTLGESGFGQRRRASAFNRDRDNQSITAGLATSQAGIGALNRAVHGQSRQGTRVRTQPDLPWA